jgi:hypothetical protein
MDFTALNFDQSHLNCWAMQNVQTQTAVKITKLIITLLLLKGERKSCLYGSTVIFPNQSERSTGKFKEELEQGSVATDRISVLQQS